MLYGTIKCPFDGVIMTPIRWEEGDLKKPYRWVCPECKFLQRGGIDG